MRGRKEGRFALKNTFFKENFININIFPYYKSDICSLLKT